MSNPNLWIHNTFKKKLEIIKCKLMGLFWCYHFKEMSGALMNYDIHSTHGLPSNL